MAEFDSLLDVVRADQDDALAARPPVGARARRPLPRKHPATLPLRYAGVLAAAAIVMLYLWIAPPSTQANLTATSLGAFVVPGMSLAAGQTERALSFSDGTALILRPETRGTLSKLGPHGAELSLERGSVSANIVHTGKSEWRVAAGPFTIHVTGTRFDAAWDADHERLEVKMFEGSVDVSSHCLQAPRSLVAGDATSFSCRIANPAPVAAPSSSVADDTPQARPGPLRGAAPDPSTEAAPSWQELAADSRFREALAAAEDVGFSALVAQGNAPELLELGDVARLAGNPARAAEAYLAVRAKAPGSAAAASAAFHLGRQAFDGSRDYAAAERWLSAYLAERPGGPLAAEALGRVLEAQHRSGRAEVARETAQRYLNRFPPGAHAPLARSIVGD